MFTVISCCGFGAQLNNAVLIIEMGACFWIGMGPGRACRKFKLLLGPLATLPECVYINALTSQVLSKSLLKDRKEFFNKLVLSSCI